MFDFGRQCAAVVNLGSVNGLSFATVVDVLVSTLVYNHTLVIVICCFEVELGRVGPSHCLDSVLIEAASRH